MRECQYRRKKSTKKKITRMESHEVMALPRTKAADSNVNRDNIAKKRTKPKKTRQQLPEDRRKKIRQMCRKMVKKQEQD